MTDAQRRTSIEQAALAAGMNAKAVEKDWWVTLALKVLFNSKYSAHLIFKGGTSLSKCWKLIERFSEDIDIGLAPEVFGFSYKENPSKSYVERLRKRGCEFTSSELKKEIELLFANEGVPAGMIVITAAEVNPTFPDTDPQSLYVKYPSLFDPNPYLADQVKIEVGARTMNEPTAKMKVQSLLYENFPNEELYSEIPFDVHVVDAQKTFLEKAFLLHEEFSRPDRSKIRTQRLSRHLYDLTRMMDAEVGINALKKDVLYSAIIKHRADYSRYAWLDYSTLERSKISFLPPKDFMEAFREDYQVMQEQMIYGDSPEFNVLMERISALMDRFRGK